jgi:AcrR family transcriptional regulator
MQGGPDEAELQAWYDALHPDALRILEAARDVLLEGGLRDLTVENVVLHAGTDAATLHMHFADESDLQHALFDRLYIEQLWLHEKASVLVAPIADPEAPRAMFELAPLAFHDPDMRARFAAYYMFARDATLHVTGLATDGDGAGHAKRLEALAALIVATVEGLAFQTTVDHSVDRDLALALLVDMISLLKARNWE